MIKFKEETKNAFYNLLKAISINEFQEINENDTDGCTVLHRAAQVSEPEIVELLIKKGANVNERNNRNETPLHLAAFLGRRKNVRALIKNGAEVNARSNNKAVPLHLASLAGRIRTVEELINAGGDMNAIDRFECSPLNYAKIYPRVTSYLEKKGVNMVDVEVKCEKANEVIEEIMNRRKEGKMMNLEEVKELILEEFSSFGKAEKVKITEVMKELGELTEKTEDALSRLNLKEKVERRIEEIREKLEDEPLVKKALLEVDHHNKNFQFTK